MSVYMWGLVGNDFSIFFYFRFTGNLLDTPGKRTTTWIDAWIFIGVYVGQKVSSNCVLHIAQVKIFLEHTRQKMWPHVVSNRSAINNKQLYRSRSYKFSYLNLNQNQKRLGVHHSTNLIILINKCLCLYAGFLPLLIYIEDLPKQ
jgi:hypothetical protein